MGRKVRESGYLSFVVLCHVLHCLYQVSVCIILLSRSFESHRMYHYFVYLEIVYISNSVEHAPWTLQTRNGSALSLE